jgi:uncharacterized protein (TIRG00374 family)
MRKFIIALIFLCALLFIVSRLTEVEQVLATFQKANWIVLLVAFGIQLLWLVNLACSFKSIYRLLGVKESLLRMIRLVAAAAFVNIVTPSMGMGGMAFLIADGQKRNHPSSRVTTGAAMYILYEYWAVLVILAVGLSVLIRRNQLTTGEIITSCVLSIMAVGLAGILYLGMRSPSRLGTTLAWLAALVNKLAHLFTRRDWLQVERAYTFAEDIGNGLKQARRSRKGLLIPFGFALSSKILMIGILMLVFIAFGEPYSPEVLIAGYSIGYLFTIVAITPSGIGFAEGALMLTLNSLRIPLATATIIALAYRGVTYWLPLVYGMIAFRWVSREPALQSTKSVVAKHLSSQQ